MAEVGYPRDAPATVLFGEWFRFGKLSDQKFFERTQNLVASTQLHKNQYDSHYHYMVASTQLHKNQYDSHYHYMIICKAKQQKTIVDSSILNIPFNVTKKNQDISFNYYRIKCKGD
ncbi:hypothetical protein LXL04_028176 [Taraxacum kok-saghyz]